jgi:hypothetical protein
VRELRRYLVFAPIAAVCAAAGTLTLLGSAPQPDGPALTFTLDGNQVAVPVEPAFIRRRTITPEFDPPLDLRAGRVIFARGFIACDEGEIFLVNVTVTQDGANGRGRTAGRCTGEVQEWTAVVTARGGTEFSEGPAHACAVATTRRVGVTDTFTWCADPVLTAAD